MNATAATGTDETRQRDPPWHQPTPGPIATIASPREMTELTYELRSIASRHNDAAWIHPSPAGQRGSLANISQDLYDAVGAVGLSQPRSVGERHLVRPLVHLVHGPVRHVLIDDASTSTWTRSASSTKATLIAQTQLWLLLDAADRPTQRNPGTTRVAEWVNAVCTVRPPAQVVQDWDRRTATGTCDLAPPNWWHHPPTAAPSVLGQPLLDT